MNGLYSSIDKNSLLPLITRAGDSVRSVNYVRLYATIGFWRLWRAGGFSSSRLCLFTLKYITAFALLYSLHRGGYKVGRELQDLLRIHAQTLHYRFVDVLRSLVGYRCTDSMMVDKFLAYPSNRLNASPNDVAPVFARAVLGQHVEVSGEDGTGQTGWYHPRDVLKKISWLSPWTNYLFVNCDYHCEIPRYLQGQALLMHTLVPRSLVYHSASRLEYFDRNEYVTRTTDGITWRHELWDWKPRLVAVPSLFGEWIYDITCRRGNGNDAWVLAVPISWVPGSHHTSALPMSRVDVCDGAYNRLDSYTNRKPVVEMQLTGTPTSTIVDRHLLDRLECQYRSVKASSFTTGTIKFQLNEDESDAHYALVYDYLRTSLNREHWTWLAASEFSPVYSPLGGCEPVPQEGRATMSLKPFYLSGVAPTNCPNSTFRCIKGRIQDQRNADEDVPETYDRYAKDFRKRLTTTLLNGRPKLIRKTIEEVLLKQKRTTQVAKREAAMYSWNSGPRLTPELEMARAFQKDEVYSEPKDPRNIITLEMNHQLGYSTYTYAVQEEAKRLVWYAFGQHPRKLAQRIHALGSAHKTVAITDYSRWDGSRGKWLWTQWCLIMLTLFPDDERHLRNILAEMEDLPIRTRFAVINSGYMQLSGSPDTSIANTILNALINYLSYRMAGLNDLPAWEGLGVYGGDDGLSFGVEGMRNVFEEVAVNLGVKLKIDVLKTYQPVDFLGRIYLSPSNCGSSIRDVLRALTSLGVNTTPGSRSDRTALILKASAVLITDPVTPILTKLAYKILDLTNAWDEEMEFRNRVDLAQLTMASEEQDWGGTTTMKITRELFDQFADEPIYGPTDPVLADIVFCNYSPDYPDVEKAIDEAQTLDDLPSFMGTDHPYRIKTSYMIDEFMFGNFPSEVPTTDKVKFKTPKVDGVAQAVRMPSHFEAWIEPEEVPLIRKDSKDKQKKSRPSRAKRRRDQTRAMKPKGVATDQCVRPPEAGQ